jgi:hypothetical protein
MKEESSVSESTPSTLSKTGYRDFAVIVLILGVSRAVLPFVPVPIFAAPIIDFLLLVGVFVATVYAIYRAMSEQPAPKFAILLLLIGVFLHVLAANMISAVFKGIGPGAILFSALAQTGLMMWCIGLGAVISGILRDKNILIPVAIFLVGFDIFLVLTPLGFTKQLIKQNPNLLANVGMQIPKSTNVAQAAAHTTVATAGLVGPADLVFLGAFFLAMFKFDMRPRETIRVMVPTLITYMILVLVTGWSLPALVPIGLVTLLVNRKEFKLKKDEIASTIVLSLIVIGILAFSATRRPALPIEPSLSGVSGEYPASIKSPQPAQVGLRQSSIPSSRQNKPSPQ